MHRAPGEGSQFTLYLPLHYRSSIGPNPVGPATGPSARGNDSAWHTLRPNDQAPYKLPEKVKVRGSEPDIRPATVVPEEISDDRVDLRPGERVILITGDDPEFASRLRAFGHQQGLKVLVANQGQSPLSPASQYQPDLILLDIRLPGMSGWGVLDCLKHQSSTRHIPVFLIGEEKDEQWGRRLGALGSVVDPSPEALALIYARARDCISRQIRKLLLVEQAVGDEASLSELVAHDSQSHARG